MGLSFAVMSVVSVVSVVSGAPYRHGVLDGFKPTASIPCRLRRPEMGAKFFQCRQALCLPVALQVYGQLLNVADLLPVGPLGIQPGEKRLLLLRGEDGVRPSSRLWHSLL